MKDSVNKVLYIEIIEAYKQGNTTEDSSEIYSIGLWKLYHEDNHVK